MNPRPGVVALADHLDKKVATQEATVMQTISDTDIANARRLAARHGHNLRFTPERGWFVFDGCRWANDDKHLRVQAFAKNAAEAIFDEVKNSSQKDEIYRHAKRSQSRNSIDSMIWLARSEPGIPARLTDFDADPYLLNVANGTLDLRSWTLRAHRREDLISNLANVTYQPNAECKLWLRFLGHITGNAELMNYLRRLVGYLLAGVTTDQSLHFLHGSGSNGKSVFVEVVLALLGDYALSTSPDLVMQRRHGGIPNDVARLRGIRVAMMNETSQGAKFDEAKLKDLTGGDTLSARFLHQEFFDFKPTHRLVIRGNHKPVISGTDEGIWRRLRLVPFAVEIPEPEQDKNLLVKLTNELPGILNWALQGCREWQQSGLRPPEIVTDAVRQYREESDTLGRFVGEHCEVRKLAQVKSSVLYVRYREFCERAGERAIPSKDLPGEMQRRGFRWKRTNSGGLFEGIELAPAGPEYRSGDSW